jgi:hypothetical protein
MHREVSAGILLLATMFSVVAVAVPILILLLTRKGKLFVPAWAFVFPGLKEIINAMASAPPEASRDPILLLRARLSRLQSSLWTPPLSMQPYAPWDTARRRI